MKQTAGKGGQLSSKGQSKPKGMPPPEKADKLQRVPVFAGLPDDALRQIQKVMLVQKMSKGEVAYMSGEPPQVFIVLAGSVLWQRVNAMRKVVIDALETGGVFALGTGESQKGKQDGFVEALEDSELGAIEKERFFEMLSAYPMVALRFVEGLGKRLESVELKIKEMSLPSVSDRIVVELRRLARTNPGGSEEWYEPGQRLTHEILAGMIGVSRESVTRNLVALRRRGVVDYLHGRYRVRRSVADRLTG